MILNQSSLRKKEHSNFLEKNLKKQELIKMKFQIRKCMNCNKFTLKEKCNQCNSDTISGHPAKYSPDDKYLKYRIMDKFQKD